MPDPVKDYLARYGGGGSAAPDDPNDPVKAYLAKYHAQPPAPDDTPSYGQQALGGIASFLRKVPGGEMAQSAARALTREGGISDFARGALGTTDPTSLPEMLARGVHSLTQSPSYDRARQDIRLGEASAPAGVRNFNQFTGGALAAMAIPANRIAVAGRTLLGPTAAQGFEYGAASGLGQSDPNADIAKRAKDAAVEGTITALAGKLGDTFSTGVRGLLAKDLGTNALERQAATRATDQINYGKAADEGAAAAARGPSPQVTRALQAPDIAPYADAVRSSRQFSNADDYTVLREAYKLMSERSGTLQNRIVNANDFKAGTSLEAGDVRLAKNQMLNAADAPISVRPPIETAQSPHPDIRTAINDFWAKPGIAFDRTEGTTAQQMARAALERHSAERVVSPSLSGSPAATEQFEPAMPAWRNAVQEHARMAQNTGAFNEGADATKRMLGGVQTAAKKLTTKSAAATGQYVDQLNPDDASAFVEGSLGRLKDNLSGPSLNPKTGFGVGGSAINANRITPLINQADRQAAQVVQPSMFGPAMKNPNGNALLRALAMSFGGGGANWLGY